MKMETTICPLTASTKCIKWQLFQILPCFYREYPMLWCHLWPHQDRSTCAKLQGFWLVRLCCPCGSHDHFLFSLTLIGLGWMGMKMGSFIEVLSLWHRAKMKKMLKCSFTTVIFIQKWSCLRAAKLQKNPRSSHMK